MTSTRGIRRTQNTDRDWWQTYIKRDSRGDMYAATPPLESLNVLIGVAATEGVGYVKGKE